MITFNYAENWRTLIFIKW